MSNIPYIVVDREKQETMLRFIVGTKEFKMALLRGSIDLRDWPVITSLEGGELLTVVVDDQWQTSNPQDGDTS